MKHWLVQKVKAIGDNIIASLTKEPELFNQDGSANVGWIMWWCTQFNKPFCDGQKAWQLVSEPIIEAPFENVQDWIEGYRQQYPEAPLFEIQVFRAALVNAQKAMKYKLEPKLLVKDTLISEAWMNWYSARHCCGHERAVKIAGGRAVRMGIIPTGIEHVLREGCFFKNSITL